jgi:hypothetical protein
MVLGLNLADRVYAARDAEDAREAAARVPEHNPDHGATLRLLDALTNSSCRQQ